MASAQCVYLGVQCVHARVHVSECDIDVECAICRWRVGVCGVSECACLYSQRPELYHSYHWVSPVLSLST